MQLRASGERAVLVGYDGVAEREVDPRRLPLGTELTDALHEWAKVAYAIRRSAASGGAAAEGLAAGSAGSAAGGRAAGGAGVTEGLAADPGGSAAAGSLAEMAGAGLRGDVAGAPGRPGDAAEGSAAAGSAEDPAGGSAAGGQAAGGAGARGDLAGGRAAGGPGVTEGLAAGPGGSAAAGSPAESAGAELRGDMAGGSAAAGSARGPAGGLAAGWAAGGLGAEPAVDLSAGGPGGSAGEPSAGQSSASSVAAAVVSRRGLQLAAQVAASIGVPVSYVDPLSGAVSTVDPPPGVRVARPVEPAPWLSGLTVSAASLVLVAFMMVTLAVTLAETYPLLALAADVVVTAGLVPSLWLIHRQPIWRWVAYGAAAGIAIGWLALPFILL